MDIAGKVAIITGGAGGIGKAMAEIMLRKQAKGVFILDTNENALKKVQEEMDKKYGVGKLHGCNCDVSSLEEMEACFKEAISTFGELHIVCNNAGIINEITWQRMLEINLNGVIIGTKLAVQYLEGERWGGGAIINTASIVGLSLIPYLAVYSTSKYAILGFTRAVAAFDPEVVKKKIRVNVLCPPGVTTPLFENLVTIDKYKEIFNAFMDNLPVPVIEANELAEQCVKLIEEPRHGQVMYVSGATTHEIIKDENKAFRERTGVEATYIELRDAGV